MSAAVASAMPSARCSADPLRRELAEDERDVDEQERDEDERRGVGGALRQPDVDEQRRHLRRHLRGAEAGREEAGDGDGELHRGEEAVGVGDEGGEPPAALAPLDGQALHLALAQRDQRDLGRDEERRDQREQQHHAEIDAGTRSRGRPGGRP